MKKTKIVFSVIGIITITAIFTMDILAAEDVTPVIRFEGAGASKQNSFEDFPNIYRGEVDFTHKRHVQLYKGECGKCHHDGDGEPLSDVDDINEAGSCNDCHMEEGLLRGKALASASPDEILEHTPNAMHQLCVGCHRKSNNKANAINAPESCRACHKKIKDPEVTNSAEGSQK